MYAYTWIFLAWYIINVVSGLRAAGGNTSGILSAYGYWFDEIFGVSGCPWVPGGNQKNYKRQIYYNCDKEIQMPLAGDSGNTIKPNGMSSVHNVTVVEGVGSRTPPISNGGKPVSSIEYVSQILTGNPKGNPTNASIYNKKIFKQGTPFYNRSTNGTSATGYYYTKDASGNEIPIFDPIPANPNSYEAPAELQNGTYGPNDPNTGLPVGWNAGISTNVGGFNVPASSIPPTMVNGTGQVVYNTSVPNSSGTQQWPVQDVPKSMGNIGNLSTMNYIANTQFLDTNEIYFKSFPVQSGIQGDPLGLSSGGGRG